MSRGLQSCIDDEFFLLLLAFLQSYSRSVGDEISWAEDCDCHEFSKTSRYITFVDRKNRRDAVDRRVDCVWRGRREVHFAMGFFEKTVKPRFLASTTPLYKEVVLGASSHLQARIAQINQVLRLRWVGRVGKKVAYKRDIPHVFAAIFGQYFGYDKNEVKAVLLDAFAKYDAIPNKATIDPLAMHAILLESIGRMRTTHILTCGSYDY